jgi:hypothetical protein
VKLEVILGKDRAMPEIHTSEMRLIQEERLSAEKCLQICLQLFQHISQIQVVHESDHSTLGLASPDSFPERVTNESLPVYSTFPIMRRGAVSYDPYTEVIRSIDKDSPRKDNMMDTSMAKYSRESPKGADPTRVVPTEEYPPLMAAITATESSALSQGFGSLGDAHETVNASTAGTSVDPGGQEMDWDSADDELIYTSDVPRSLAYVQELASSFFRGLDLPDAESLERICDGLPDLLWGFAQRIGGEDYSSVHFEVMKFIYKRRV